MATQLWVRWFNAIGDHELWVDCTATGLALDAQVGQRFGLRHSVHGVEMEQPYNVSLFVWRMGAKDVRSDSFDGKDLTYRIKNRISMDSLVANESTGGASVHFESDGEGAVVRIKPSLIRPDFSANYEFVCDGVPQVERYNPVADLNLTSYYHEIKEKNIIGPTLFGVGAVSGALAILSLIVGLAGYNIDKEAFVWIPQWIWVVFLMLFGGLLLLMTGAEVAPRRARLSRKVARRRFGGRVLERGQVTSLSSLLIP